MTGWWNGRRAPWIVVGAMLFGAEQAACRRDAPATDRERSAPTVASSVAAPAAKDVPSASSSSPAEELSVVKRWNDALDHHDVVALETLYGDPVRYYGREASRRAVLDAKRAALGPKSTFHQQIVGAITLHRAGDVQEATFTKRSGSNGKATDVEAKLSLRHGDGGALVIVEETDVPSDVRRTTRSRDRCEEVASKVVTELPAAKRAIADANRSADESDGGARYGGVGPIDDADGGFSASLGLHTDDRFMELIGWSVDAAGKLTVTVLGAEQKIPAATLAAVTEACRP